MKAIASGFGILGAVLVAANIGLGLLGYIFFALSSSMWVLIAWRQKDKSLLSMNVVFFLTNVLGLIRWS